MAEMNIETARQNMIAQQIRPWSVLDDRILDLMLEVPREEFVPPQYRALAFADLEIPLGHGQSMLAPKMEARLLQALQVRPEESVLEVGTGSGYMTALLGHLAKHVYSVDCVEAFTADAAKRLARHGIENVSLDTGDASRGWERRGQYDAIAVTGSVMEVADGFLESLKVGGRLFIVAGRAPAMEALLITRLGESEFARQCLFETVIPPLLNAQQKRFVF